VAIPENLRRIQLAREAVQWQPAKPILLATGPKQKPLCRVVRSRSLPNVPQNQQDSGHYEQRKSVVPSQLPGYLTNAILRGGSITLYHFV
jgi:hypothetical protein